MISNSNEEINITNSRELIKLLNHDARGFNDSQRTEIINSVYHQNKDIVINAMYELSKNEQYINEFITIFMYMDKDILDDIAANYKNKYVKKIIGCANDIRRSYALTKFEFGFYDNYDYLIAGIIYCLLKDNKRKQLNRMLFTDTRFNFSMITAKNKIIDNLFDKGIKELPYNKDIINDIGLINLWLFRGVKEINNEYIEKINEKLKSCELKGNSND